MCSMFVTLNPLKMKMKNLRGESFFVTIARATIAFVTFATDVRN